MFRGAQVRILRSLSPKIISRLLFLASHVVADLENKLDSACSNILCRPCSASILQRYPPMVHYEICCLLFLVNAGLWGRSRGCSCFTLHRPGRIGHVDQAFCCAPYRSGTTSSHVLRVCYYRRSVLLMTD